MLDVGLPKPPAVNPADSFRALKENLDDPAAYFLGDAYEAVLYPDSEAEYYGFPPSKTYVFSTPNGHTYRSQGFAPLHSFARGGLAQAWTGGVYPFNDEELSDFPFGYRDIAPAYNTVAERIGITGARDDLARFFPVHEHLMAPLRLDPHSERLLEAYEAQKPYLNDKLRCYIGRSRVATLSSDRGGRKGCTYTGRCLWGCPSESLYTPSITLKLCKRFDTFRYLPNVYVDHFVCDARRRITHVVAHTVDEGTPTEFPVDKLILAAGTLSSSRIVLNSIYRHSGEVAVLRGLMDNRQILMPFVNRTMIGRDVPQESYQYHLLGMGLEGTSPKEYVHSQITALKTALVHPIIQKMPLDLRGAIGLFRGIHAALGVVNVNLHDTRREDNYVTLAVDKGSKTPQFVIQYTPPSEEPARLKKVLKTVKKCLSRLGCIVPPGMTYIRPMGASVHYSGTIPMTTAQAPLTVSPACRSNDFADLYIADGTTFPFLPAKNLTFTLMANATRVAEGIL